jgi:hypothetical protein
VLINIIKRMQADCFRLLFSLWEGRKGTHRKWEGCIREKEKWKFI